MSSFPDSSPLRSFGGSSSSSSSQFLPPSSEGSFPSPALGTASQPFGAPAFLPTPSSSSSAPFDSSAPSAASQAVRFAHFFPPLANPLLFHSDQQPQPASQAAHEASASDLQRPQRHRVGEESQNSLQQNETQNSNASGFTARPSFGDASAALLSLPPSFTARDVLDVVSKHLTPLQQQLHLVDNEIVPVVPRTEIFGLASLVPHLAAQEMDAASHNANQTKPPLAVKEGSGGKGGGKEGGKKGGKEGRKGGRKEGINGDD
eukprot:GHVT01034359.1.p1 GENE.GHVT01034359.1~~GHVT01034359.1.p1  ORF type:complete len:261 (+),score=91.72 GHVT01034359.1:735-1517(+)